jgi:hypothetical protein
VSPGERPCTNSSHAWATAGSHAMTISDHPSTFYYIHVDGSRLPWRLGLLILRPAFSTAALREPDRASDAFAEAARLAEITGEANSWDMYLGPANVAAWRVGVDVDAGNPARVVETARGPSHL